MLRIYHYLTCDFYQKDMAKSRQVWSIITARASKVTKQVGTTGRRHIGCIVVLLKEHAQRLRGYICYVPDLKMELCRSEAKEVCIFSKFTVYL
jgi:hypothetical protein